MCLETERADDAPGTRPGDHIANQPTKRVKYYFRRLGLSLSLLALEERLFPRVGGVFLQMKIAASARLYTPMHF